MAQPLRATDARLRARLTQTFAPSIVMTLEPDAANEFIRWYKALLLEIEGAHSPKPNRDVLSVMASARHRLSETPALLDDAVSRLSAKLGQVNEAVIRAIRTLSVKNWVFLRDTKTYSIFLDASGNNAYGVLGLTDRIRDISGGSGVVIETGIVRFAGRFVCDGLITRILHLGPGFRKSFGQAYREAKAAGRFHTNDVA